ncbi:MAG: PIG-L family deacetylase [Ilumatobacter sp.]|nr:PIG-L family deacetylase [Ilumatobacter sp.]
MPRRQRTRLDAGCERGHPTLREEWMQSETTRMLVTVAHPDDETFGCGSLLAHAAAHGVQTMVVCATRGEAGSPAPGTQLDVDLAVVREVELREAAALLGVDRVRLLGYTDSGMDGEPAPGTLAAADVEDVTVDLIGIIEDFRPHVVVTLDGSDGHRDHAQIRDATDFAVRWSRWRTERFYLHCLPQQLMRQWVCELQAKQPDAAHLALGELGTPNADITTVIDTSDLLDVREQAIAIHASQTSPYEVMGAELRREFLATERLRRIRPEWTGGGVERSLFEPALAVQR